MTETLETVVTGDSIDIPAAMREMLHIQDGDRIRWTCEGDRLVVQVIKKQKGSLTAPIGKFSGEPTDSVKTHNLNGDYTKERKEWLEKDPEKYLAAVIAHGKKKTRV